jgi:hypothetical protein
MLTWKPAPSTEPNPQPAGPSAWQSLPDIVMQSSAAERPVLAELLASVLRRCSRSAFGHLRLDQLSEEALRPFHKRQSVRKAGFQ